MKNFNVTEYITNSYLKFLEKKQNLHNKLITIELNLNDGTYHRQFYEYVKELHSPTSHIHNPRQAMFKPMVQFENVKLSENVTRFQQPPRDNSIINVELHYLT